MKDIITIIVRLTVSCLLAAAIMGLFFVFTSNAKKHNEHVKEQQVMYELLGYEGEPPASLAMHEIYRYVIRGKEGLSIGYLIPQGHGEETKYLFVNIDLDGKMIANKKVALTEAEALEAETRNKAVQETVGIEFKAVFADQTIVVTDDGKRVAYLLGGKFQGFKTFVHVMLAMKPDFTLIGLEVLEHEEDPGLGAEIEQDYFKNQFKGKPYEAIKAIDVIKAPIPADYLAALNGKVPEEQVMAMREEYKNKEIYALTGATISTRSVCNGVKGIVTKFAYRVNVLDKVLQDQQLAVSF